MPNSKCTYVHYYFYIWRTRIISQVQEFLDPKKEEAYYCVSTVYLQALLKQLTKLYMQIHKQWKYKYQTQMGKMLVCLLRDSNGARVPANQYSVCRAIFSRCILLFGCSFFLPPFYFLWTCFCFTGRCIEAHVNAVRIFCQQYCHPFWTELALTVRNHLRERDLNAFIQELKCFVVLVVETLETLNKYLFLRHLLKNQKNQNSRWKMVLHDVYFQNEICNRLGTYSYFLEKQICEC